MQIQKKKKNNFFYQCLNKIGKWLPHRVVGLVRCTVAVIYVAAPVKGLAHTRIHFIFTIYLAKWWYKNSSTSPEALWWSVLCQWAWPISCQYISIGFLNCSLFTQEICNSVCMGLYGRVGEEGFGEFGVELFGKFGYSSTSPEALWWSVVLCQYGPGQFPANTFLLASWIAPFSLKRYVTVYAWGYMAGLVRRALVSLVWSYLASLGIHLLHLKLSDEV